MATAATVTGRASKKAKSSENGMGGKLSTAQSSPRSDDLALILGSLQTMRDGDFSVRLPVAWVGLEGKIADTFNDIVAANEQMARELNRVGQAVGKEGKTRERTSTSGSDFCAKRRSARSIACASSSFEDRNWVQ